MGARPEDLQATFCATLVDEWVRCGVQHAVLSPGSRSTPLALALVADDRVQLQVHPDERSAGFLALGLALASGEPTVVVTTSGTAAVELHPAVVEADLAEVPLLVCTADRPPELIGVGAPQAIDQTHLFGRAVRWFHAPGVADAAATDRWRPLAARAYADATSPRPGPVHLNLAFREPLVGVPGELPAGRPGGSSAWAWRPHPQPPVEPVISVAEDLAGRRGVVVAGAGSGEADLVAAVATALGWPILAAPQAPVWSRTDVVVPAADAFLRVPAIGEELRPEVILRLGAPLASRVVGEWTAATGAPEVVAAGTAAWSDPGGTASVVLPVAPADLLHAWSAELPEIVPVDPAWAGRWREVGGIARTAVDRILDAEPGPTEPGAIRALLAALPDASPLVVSSSMPIRDLEWYAVPGGSLRVHANRGANGIDGVVATAVGVAVASAVPTALVIGDLAFLHDLNGLLGTSAREVDLVCLLLDNDGGGIFSFLPQADAVEPAVFESVYGTPHGLDLAAVAAAHGATARRVEGDVTEATRDAIAAGGVQVLVVRTARAANRDLHARLNAAVADALGS
jgi:2-succinyl-5-enolpyruvyl-6-hydroxy-3-cyclohexene-1-carboxylate synthase